MTGAARFLYGLALGISLGIIASKLAGAAAPGPYRRTRRSSRPRAVTRVVTNETERQEAAAR